MNANMNANTHSQISDLLALYAAGTLDRDRRLAVEQHLPACAECQADLALWKALAGEVVAADQAVIAPRNLADQALARVRQPRPAAAGTAQKLRPGEGFRLRPGEGFKLRFSEVFRLRRALQLLRSQAPLVQREIWPVSALVIGLGFIVALMAAKSAVIYALAPLIAATCVSLIYGPDNDPAFELALSTPTSPRQILLARLVLVFGYNLLLSLVAVLGLLPMLANQASQPLVGTLLLTWLAPMTFLSAAALVLSLWIGAPNAIIITYIAWMGQLLAGPLRSPQAGMRLSPGVIDGLAAYQHFWQAPLLLLALSALLLAAALWLAGHKGQGYLNPA